MGMSAPLLNTDDLQSLLIFEKLCDDWVREVHKFNSQRKKKKNFVIFRNVENKKLTSLEELKQELDDTSFLENATFKSGFSHDIVSNKVGANKIARKQAKAWMAESAGKKCTTKTKVAKLISTEKLKEKPEKVIKPIQKEPCEEEKVPSKVSEKVKPEEAPKPPIAAKKETKP